ncbi:uncharacterized protein B0I36DRAFT_364699 [Microdochium trichocladiopsis]|uniref:Ubiquitin carboxyl-terminal hydrolase n=1 Tax=Microdochium trichocladiopsis TaxID=1682393 RepID=A0A9P8Y2Y4_9PEZI|nr:uncharacterized protein B0I36DRAFT_364699 [Microdochium trichocladiopsis]KAH7027509.1 hypothetical protein B0I36DRAFT_364699 [Microdochium trichocladiopsis]
MSFLNKWKTGSTNASSPAAKDAQKKKEKEEAEPEVTPLEKMLLTAGAVREDGSDKFFGMENFGNTCYCNSIVQALYFTLPFRQHVLNYPVLSPSSTPNGEKPKVNVTIRAPTAVINGSGPAAQKPLTAAEAMAKRKAINSGQLPPGQPIRPEDKPDTPEYKKKQAMLKGPILELAQDNSSAYGMDECSFTALRDIFTTLVESGVRTGVLSPQRFLEIFKRDNEMFRNSMHQDAHEFYGLILNDVIANVESNAQRLLKHQADAAAREGTTASLEQALGAVAKSSQNGMNSPGTGWVHNIFEGLLTSETKCLTCETASQRDETFLDLSIDLEEHSSVTACLQKFSAEEMLCERNKFHCDNCGGLQEAEKRMKIKRLPKVLALHLKRFKYTEDYSRLQKLFHRVVYPYHLRMFNTTDEAEDPDRIYELYAVVVHIGGNAYHGHYISVIKTEDRGWLLFDDEMVEPVDKHYVRNFFGDKPGTACAYVLFYQETTFEKVRAEQEAEGLEEVRLASEKANIAQENGAVNATAAPITKQTTLPVTQPEETGGLAKLEHAATAPGIATTPVAPPVPAVPSQAEVTSPQGLSRWGTIKGDSKSKEDKKEAKALEKARKQAEKDEQKAKEKQRKENEIRLREARRTEADNLKKAMEESRKTFDEDEGKRKDTDSSAATATPTSPAADSATASNNGTPNSLNRSSTGAHINMARKSFSFLNKDKLKRDSAEVENTHAFGSGDANHGSGKASGDAFEPKSLKKTFTFGLGRKKSKNVLS